MVVINGQNPPEAPFHEGTVLAFEQGRSIHIRSAEEATELAEAATFVAENWEN